jgi:polysaccharide deacetylase family protein (PEP-CTERM system associated)
MNNVLTIDLEDYYQATAFSGDAKPGSVVSHASRVERNTDRVLELLLERKTLATFFIVGSIAERFPRMIRRIADVGHELACHSYAHREVFTLSRDEFYEDTHRAKSILEDAGGVPVNGYRAPSFSINDKTEWAFEILAKLGFRYDSSIFPIRHLNFRMQGAPSSPFLIPTGEGVILEFPMTTLQIFGGRAPLAGGAYLRFLPYWYTCWGIRYLNESQGVPACVYLHPWELDPEQPRMKGSFTARLRHYFGLRQTEQKFRHLLVDFAFQTLGNLVAELENQQTVKPLLKVSPRSLLNSVSTN